MARRECGTCTLCCKVLGIRELEKPRGSWCPSCAKGRGCTVYEARPTSCRDFECFWLKAPEAAHVMMPDALRPDRCKVVFVVPPDGAGLVAETDPATPTAWQRPDVLAVLRAVASTGQVAGVFAGSRRWVVHPDGGFTEVRD
ncbi:hypothetical protein [Prosthecomicrobium sp. N25]|uniref:hypothetical protein n=1 Tax=Prosthecomicrobium sp. N25 TaxID=3129254 RepID=UPI003077D584